MLQIPCHSDTDSSGEESLSNVEDTCENKYKMNDLNFLPARRIQSGGDSFCFVQAVREESLSGKKRKNLFTFKMN